MATKNSDKSAAIGTGKSAASQSIPVVQASRTAPAGRRRFSWKSAALAILVGLVTGLGTGFAGATYDKVKSWLFSIVFNDSFVAFTEEPSSPNCNTYQLVDSEKALSSTGLFEWKWSVGIANGSWSGRAIKRDNPNIIFFVSGSSLGGRASISFRSIHDDGEGIGAYLLEHADNDGKGREYYRGFWVGRECSIVSHPFVKCPMIVTPSTTISESDARALLPHQACTLSEP
jgi:hypothetical protein